MLVLHNTRSVTRSYYRGAIGCLLVYDVTWYVKHLLVFSMIYDWLLHSRYDLRCCIQKLGKIILSSSFFFCHGSRDSYNHLVSWLTDARTLARSDITVVSKKKKSNVIFPTLNHFSIYFPVYGRQRTSTLWQFNHGYGFGAALLVGLGGVIPYPCCFRLWLVTK